MAQLTSSLVVRLIDQVSAPARRMAGALTGLNRTASGNFGTRLTGAINANNAALGAARGKLFDAAAAFYVLQRAISSPIQDAMSFESAMADVRKVVDFDTPEGFQDFQQELIALSKRVPQTVNGLAAIAAAAGQAGIAGEDLVRFTEAAAKIGTAFDMDPGDIGLALSKMRDGLGLTIDELISLSDAMNHLSNSQASSASEILDVVRRVGAQAKLYGFTAEQTAAFASAMIAAGAQSQVAATSFRNMGMALTRGASATKRQSDALKVLGLDAETVAANMQMDATGTVVDVLERLAALPKEIQGAVSSDLFGNEARALGPLLTNLDLVRKSLGLVADEAEYSGSAFNEFEIRAQTFENAVAIFNNRLTALKITIGNALIPMLTTLMDKISPAVDAIAKFTAAHPDLTRNVVAATTALIAFKAATAALSFVGLMGKGGALSLMSIGYNTVGKAIIGATVAARSATGLHTALAAMNGIKVGGMESAVVALRGMAMAIPGIGGIGTALTAVGAALATISAPVWGAIAAVVTALAASGFVMWKYWDRLTSVIGGFASRIGEELKPALDLLQPVLGPISGLVSGIGDAFGAAGEKISEFMGWIGSFFQREVLTDEQKAAFGQAGYDAADNMITSIKDKIMEIIEWFKELPGMILNAIGTIDIGSLIKAPDLGGMISGLGQRLLGGGEPANNNVYGPQQPDAHRAHGGPVWSGGSFMVGEKEPELFTPRGNGTITPTSKLDGGPVTVNITLNGIAGDAMQIARTVAREVEDTLDRLLDGAHSDSGVRY